jgi:hypothetical protein
MTAATATAPRTQILTRGSHAWRITRYTDTHFVAVNNKGVTRVYNSESQCDSFWNFLESVGFRLRQDGWSLTTVVKKETPAPVAAAPVAEPRIHVIPNRGNAEMAARYAASSEPWSSSDCLDWRDRDNASK